MANNIKNLIQSVAGVLVALATVLMLAISCGKENPDNPDPTPKPDPDPDPKPAVAAYKFEVSNINTWSAAVSISAQNNGAYYYCGAISKEDYASLGSDEALIESDITALKEVAELYEDVDYAGYAKTQSRSGNAAVIAKGLLADTEYYVYAFTFSEDFLSGSDLCKSEFRTKKAEKVECTFTIDVTNVTKKGAQIKVTPSDESCTYFCDYVTAAEYANYGGDEGIAAANVDLIRRAIEIYQMAGYDKSFTDFLYTGTVADTPDALISGTDYVVFAFGLDPSGTPTTDVTVKTFKTDAPDPSSLTFTTEVFDLKFNGAKIGFTPSNDDETFFTDCMDYETFSKFSSEQDVIAWVLSQAGSNITSYLAQGYHVVDASDLLISETKYVAYAFGYDNGATTGLTTVEFTTPSMPTGSGVSVKIDYEFVNGSVFGASYEGQIALVATLTPSPAAAHWYAAMFSSLDGFSDSVVTEALQANGQKDRNQVGFIVKPGQKYILAAVAVDASGTAGALNKVTVTAPASVPSANAASFSGKVALSKGFGKPTASVKRVSAFPGSASKQESATPRQLRQNKFGD